MLKTPRDRYIFIKKYENIFPVSRMCHVIGINRSAYYAWKKNPQSNRELENIILLERIKTVFYKYKQRYGSPKITYELKKMGYHYGHNRIARLMRINNLRSKVVKKYRPKNNVIKKKDAVENILNRRFNWKKPNKAWVTDITYIPTKKGWVYLCVYLDLCTRYIVGWSVSYRMKAELVTESLIKACKNRSPKNGLIIHSDQGVQYGSALFKDIIKRHKFVQSMSRRGNCWDNSCVESFFRLLKTEELNDYDFNNIEEVQYKVFCYIEHFYNRQRAHSYLNYMSPLDYEQFLSA